MKRVYTLLIMFLGLRAMACGPYLRAYLPDEYHTYRVLGDDMLGTGQQQEDENKKANCQDWAALTSTKISLTDIEDVVYNWSLPSLRDYTQAVRDGGDGSHTNTFANWLGRHKDLEVLDFLILAKEREEVFNEKKSAWYYHVEGDEADQRLDRVIEQARQYTGQRLHDRYTLQLLRALSLRGRTAECCKLWEEEGPRMKSGIIKRLCGLVAIYAYPAQPADQRIQAALESGLDVEACHFAGIGGISTRSVEWLYSQNPDSPYLLQYMQKLIHKAEAKNWVDDHEATYRELLAIVRQIVQDDRCRDMAPWHYSYAYLLDRNGEPQQALPYIEKAYRNTPSGDLHDAVRTLRMYLTVKCQPAYDNKTERFVYRELKWLDAKMKKCLDTDMNRELQGSLTYYHQCRMSIYYWSDMMRKFLLSSVVPLCVKSDYITRSLQYTGMADYALLNYIGRLENYSYDAMTEDYKYVTQTLAEFRSDPDTYNDYDYRTDLFESLDSLPVLYAERLLEHIQHPKGRIDKFLNAHGYTDANYFMDIIGTKYICSRQYAKAVSYLRLVPGTFQASRNVAPYFNRDPFSLKRRKTADNPFYKLEYARRMNQLEQDIQAATDPNAKAQLMLTYALGLQQQAGDWCWALSRYYNGSFYFFDFYSREMVGNLNAALSEAERIKQEAFALFTDDELAAKAYSDWFLFKTAAEKFPGTSVAQHIHGHCDQLKDYLSLPGKYLTREEIERQFEEEMSKYEEEED